MKVSIEATREDVLSALDWISGFMGASIDKRVAALRQQERKNPLLTLHARENYALEFALAEARKYRRSTNRIPKGDAYDALYGFLIAAQRVYRGLPTQAIKAFEGQLDKAASDQNGLRPFAYELSIAMHFMSRQWNVEFADYSGLGTFDLLARRDSLEIEVECKAPSGDGGRKIHRQEVNRLADLILPIVQELARQSGCSLLRITVPGRLGKAASELSSIASLVAAATSHRTHQTNEFANVEFIATELSSWPEPERDPDFRLFFENLFGLKNCNLLFMGRRGVSLVAVAIVSAQADGLVKSLGDQAKEAADQCTGTRPALIALHLTDPISRTELESLLHSSNGLHSVAAAVFDSDKRSHVDSIAFTVPQSSWSDGRGTTGLSGNLVQLNNPQPKFAGDEIRKVFRTP